MSMIATVRRSGGPEVRKSGSIALLLACLLTVIHGADDPYAAWGHGRPQDAIASLHQQAVASDRWDAWFDLGLAALAAGRQSDGIAWLLAAHRRAPERPEPRQALRAIKVTPPLGWLDRLGPLAAPGLGWSGVVLITLAGLLLGYGVCARRRRVAMLLIGGGMLLVSVPGRIAWEHDHGRLLVATVRDSQLYDSAGRPIIAIPAGTVLEQETAAVWAERILVHDAQGHRGHLPLADTIAKP
jgi:Tetratricopeptide repeat